MEMASGDQCAPIDSQFSLGKTPDEAQCSIHSPEKDSKVDEEFELEKIIIDKTSLTSKQ